MAETDREVLALAAKAAGYMRMVYRDDVPYVSRNLSGDDFVAWNPRDNDGDALRLLAKLPSLWSLKLMFGQPHIEMSVAWGLGRGIVACESSGKERDRTEAIRLAIVRAAAEIGKAMP